MSNSGTTTASAIADAINKVATGPLATDPKFVVNMSTVSGGYVHGTDLPTSGAVASTTITTTTAGTITIAAKTTDSKYNGTHIVWDTTGTSATPSVSYSTANGGTLKIQIRGTTDPANTTTQLSDVAAAINNSTDIDVQNFAASAPPVLSTRPRMALPPKSEAWPRARRRLPTWMPIRRTSAIR